MALLKDWKGAKLIKTLYLGLSGAGKTGSLASLANAGYNVRIVDLENKLGALLNVLTDAKSPYKRDAIQRVSAITVRDAKAVQGNRLVMSAPKAYERTLQVLHHWKDDTEDLGSVTAWTDKDVLVIDSLSAFSKAAFRTVLAMNGRLGQRPHQADYGVAQDMIEDFLEMLTDASIGCHVIVIAHIAYIQAEGEAIAKGHPQTVGSKLSPKIGRFFDACLMAQSVGFGNNVKKKILTNTSGVVELKNTAPLRVPAELPLESGLADYFKAVQDAQAAVPAEAKSAPPSTGLTQLAVTVPLPTLAPPVQAKPAA